MQKRSDVTPINITGEKKSTRPVISKRLRFEVFKRDSFKCQYCGASAPEVILHVDHIEAVANGGATDITNLVTACDSCNLGKGARRLDDNTAIKKAKAQLDELQERREQLELLFEWKRGLLTIEDEVLDKVCDFWLSRVPHLSISKTGRADINKWIKTFTLDEVLTSIQIATDKYLEYKSGDPTSESATLAFSKIPGVCISRKNERSNPFIPEIYYIRGILKNRIKYSFFDPQQALWMIKNSVAAGVPTDRIKAEAIKITTWREFKSALSALEYEYSTGNTGIGDCDHGASA